MTGDELAKIVRMTREAQSRYFRDRDRANISLESARDLERVLDATVRGILEGPSLLKEDADG